MLEPNERDLEWEAMQMEQLKAAAERMSRFLYIKATTEQWGMIAQDVSMVAKILNFNFADTKDWRWTTQARAANPDDRFHVSCR